MSSTSNEFITKLPDVLSYLLQLRKPLPDDTCLQRLLDLLRLHVQEEEVESSGLIPFIKHIIDNPSDIDDSVLTFSLLLCGNLACKEEVYQKYDDVINGLLKHVQHLLKDSSIGTAYYTCCSGIASHKTGIHGFCAVSENIQLVMNGMKYGESVFLQSAARNLIKILVTSPHVSTSHQINDLIKDLISELEALCPTNINFSKCLLSLFDELGISNFFSHGFERDQLLQILKSCLKLCLTVPSVSLYLVLEVIKWCLDNMNNEDKDISMGEFEIELKKLVDTDLVRTHKIACYLHQYSVLYGDFVNLPFAILFGTEEVAISYNQKMTKTMMTTIIIQTLSCKTEKAELYRELDFIMKILKIIQDIPQDVHSINRPYLLNNNQLLTKILQILYDKLELIERLKGDYSSQLFQLLLATGSNIPTNIQIYKSCMKCILLILASDESGELVDVTEVIKLLQMKLCDIKWEARDTTLEIINQIITVIKDRNEVSAVISLSRLSWLSISDSNSYVRASVINVISSIANHKQLFQQFLTDTEIKLTDIISKLVTILNEDSEAFARRSAVMGLKVLYTTCHTDQQPLIHSTMLKSMNDFDWEVKILVLEFWEKCFLSVLHQEDVLSGSPYGTGLPCVYNKDVTSVRGITNSEFYQALLLGHNDYEESVSEKASIMIKHLIELWDSGKVEVCENGVTSKIDMKSWMKKLKCLDIESKFYNTDEYTRNPVSLLDDILATAGEQDEDNFVDCY